MASKYSTNLYAVVQPFRLFTDANLTRLLVPRLFGYLSPRPVMFALATGGYDNYFLNILIKSATLATKLMRTTTSTIGISTVTTVLNQSLPKITNMRKSRSKFAPRASQNPLRKKTIGAPGHAHP
jgi:hypothetical protein